MSRDVTSLHDLKGEVSVASWKAPGPRSDAYTRSDKLIRGMIGPNGCAKTTTMLTTEIFCAIRAPLCVDGVRRYSFLCLRDNYRQLYKTAIPSWLELFRPAADDWNEIDFETNPGVPGKWSGGVDRPAEHFVWLEDDYGPIELHGQFAAVPDGDIEAFMDGYQVTSIIFNGISSIPEKLFTVASGRIGRYPPRKKLAPGGRNEKHIGFDMNKTDVEHWCYQRFVVNHDPEVMDVYDFPSGLAPDAENLQNLDETYYQDMVRMNQNRPDYVKRFVKNEWGASLTGEAVYANEFREKRHVAEADFAVDPRLDLCIGLDAGTVNGGRPAAVFFQVTPSAHVRIVDELYLGRAGPTKFFKALLGKLDEAHLAPCAQRLKVYADPSAFYGADTESGEKTWVMIGELALGVTFIQPESNELEGFRLETTRVLMNTSEGDVQGYLMSPRCRQNRKGKTGSYKYTKKETANGAVEDPTPNKRSEASHIQDAEQHGLTGYFGYSLIQGKVRQRRNQNAGSFADHGFSADFDVFSEI